MLPSEMSVQLLSVRIRLCKNDNRFPDSTSVASRRNLIHIAWIPFGRGGGGNTKSKQFFLFKDDKVLVR